MSSTYPYYKHVWRWSSFKIKDVVVAFIKIRMFSFFLLSINWVIYKHGVWKIVLDLFDDFRYPQKSLKTSKYFE